MSSPSLNRQLAVQYLAQNMQPSIVAGILGVTESAISQLLADEDFAAEVTAASQGAAASDLAYDDRMDKAEEVFLQNIENRAQFANMQQSLQAFKLLNSARRRKDTRVHNSASNNGVTVNIMLPSSIVPDYTMNAQAEIVEVSGKTMLSATPSGVNELLAARQAAKAPVPVGVSAAVEVSPVKATRALQHLQHMTNRPERKKIPLVDLI